MNSIINLLGTLHVGRIICTYVAWADMGILGLEMGKPLIIDHDFYAIKYNMGTRVLWVINNPSPEGVARGQGLFIIHKTNGTHVITILYPAQASID